MTRHWGRSLTTASDLSVLPTLTAPLISLEPDDPILTQPGPNCAVESSCDLDHLQVPLRGGGAGGARPLRGAASADQGVGRAARHTGAVPRAALLHLAPGRLADKSSRDAR